MAYTFIIPLLFTLVLQGVTATPAERREALPSGYWPMSNDVEYSSQYWPYSSYPPYSQPSLIIPPYSGGNYMSASAYPSQASAYPSYAISSSGPIASGGFGNYGQQSGGFDNGQNSDFNNGQNGGAGPAAQSSEALPSSNGAASSFISIHPTIGDNTFLLLGALTGIIAFAL